MGKTIIQTITDNLEPDNENGKLSARQLRGINAAGTQYESGIYNGFGNNCEVTISETPMSFDINTGLYSAGGLICEIQEPETVNYGTGTNGQYALLVATVNLIDDKTAEVSYEILKGSTTAYPKYSQQNMTYGESGITQVPIAGFKYDGVGITGLTESQNKYFVKNWGSQIDSVEALANANKSALASKADKSALDGKVARVDGPGNETGDKYVVLGKGADGTPDFQTFWKGSTKELGLRKITNNDYHGFYINEDEGRMHVYTGVSANSVTLAKYSELANKVNKAVGNGTKSVILGTNTGGGTDFELWHDMEEGNVGYRRTTGVDKHGWYINENDEHGYIYLGNESDARKLVNSVDLQDYVMKDSDGVSSYIRFADYNGGTTAPFYLQAYVNSSTRDTVKLANTFPGGEQGIYINEGAVLHIDGGTNKPLAYASDYLKLTGGTLTGALSSDHNITTSANIHGDRLTSHGGAITSGGDATGYVHNGTASTAAQDMMLLNYSTGNRRALLRDTTAGMYFSGYGTSGTDMNRGLYTTNDKFYHMTTSGGRTLMHVDEAAKSMREMSMNLDTLQAENDVLVDVLSEIVPDNEALKQVKESRQSRTSLTTKYDAVIEELEQDRVQIVEELKRIEQEIEQEGELNEHIN